MKKWKIYGELNVVDEDDNFIASCGCNGTNATENLKRCKDNAVLISLTPELLSSVIDLLAFPNNHPIKQRARKLIERAYETKGVTK